MGIEGIENDRLVFDYLSRVGDLAQQRQVPAAERRELVSGLRDEIARRRAERGAGGAGVSGILGELGTPDEVVGRVAPAPGASSSAPAAADDEAAAPGADAAGDAGASVPGPRAAEADWWRAPDTLDAVDVPGFVGGVEIPELLKPPPVEEEDGEESEHGEGDHGADADADGEEAGERAGRFARMRGLRLGSPLLLVSALLLLAGAAFGALFPLVAGWLLAYASRERRGAVLIVPGLAVTAGIVWLWGRVEGRWGDPVAAGEAGMGAAIAATWPWTLRAAAVASALFLLWRARRAARDA
ncbi:hypothetical protein ABZ135_15375 [Streptomyces sp. NPDC006339]|uniref:hypothetical protein n=1 Tax=Streptomyces sp. NPDC006339 TaxID=3156755 RepID=UPI0033A7ADA9